MALQKLTVIDQMIVSQMASMLPRYSAEDIQDRFGISLNTWSKLRKGEGIRESVAVRLLDRLEPTLGIPRAWEVPQGAIGGHNLGA